MSRFSSRWFWNLARKHAQTVEAERAVATLALGHPPTDRANEVAAASIILGQPATPQRTPTPTPNSQR